MSERSEVEERLGPKMVGPFGAIRNQQANSVKEVGKADLCMSTPNFISRGKSLVNFHNGSIHGNLLDDLAGDIDVILRK